MPDHPLFHGKRRDPASLHKIEYKPSRMRVGVLPISIHLFGIFTRLIEADHRKVHQEGRRVMQEEWRNGDVTGSPKGSRDCGIHNGKAVSLSFTHVPCAGKYLFLMVILGKADSTGTT